VELLVALAVLILLVTLVSGFANAILSIITLGNKRMEADADARLALDRLSRDWAKIVVRTDVDYRFHKQPGNDHIAFFSGTGASLSERTLSSIHYRLAESSRLERGALPIGWDGMVFSPLTRSQNLDPSTAPQPPNVLPLPADDNYDILSDSLVRFEICYLRRQPGNRSLVLTVTPPDSISDLAGIVVGVVLLDAKSRLLVPDASTLSQMFPDAMDGRDIASLWSEALEAPDFATTAGIPAAAASQLRIYQRICYLPRPPP
jgi:hypothetical protein